MVFYYQNESHLYTQAEGMGGRLQMRLTVVKMVQVGNYKFRNVPTYIYEDEYNVTSYPFVGGLLGNDFSDVLI